MQSNVRYYPVNKVLCKAVNVVSDITKELVQRLMALGSDKPQKIIAVCGAADLGKSYLCQHWVSEFTKQGISADHLSLDSYLIPRSERTAMGICGYDLAAYDWDAARNDLLKWLLGESIHHHEYDHKKGRNGNLTRKILPCSVLFLDGVHSMAEIFKPLLDYSIFIFTNDQQLIKFRRAADLKKRGQTAEFSIKNSQPAFAKYKHNIEPYKSQAGFFLELIEPWQYVHFEDPKTRKNL